MHDVWRKRRPGRSAAHDPAVVGGGTVVVAAAAAEDGCGSGGLHLQNEASLF